MSAARSKSSVQISPDAIFWFRRDLRFHDNAGLYHALKGANAVLPIFIFDREILRQFPDSDDRRVAFISKTVAELKAQLRAMGSDLLVEFGEPVEIFTRLLASFQIRQIFFNHDYEPAAQARDSRIRKLATQVGVEVFDFKDHVIFENLEVTKADGKPYTVYTPYSKKWKAELAANPPSQFPSQNNLGKFWRRPAGLAETEMPSLASLGFPQAPLDFPFPDPVVRRSTLLAYQARRDFPAIEGTSHLGLHLRFGTVSVRELMVQARAVSETWYGELIWREFFIQIMASFPHVVKGPFRPEYAKIKWRHDRSDFERWCEGQTGVPIVDAGMRELNATGFMHNRVRMITASYLSKSLLIDWQWGEEYFARKLLDFDLASNNGNWQWVAGCGCDAAPYFRIFNPDLQAKKFDPERLYVKTWIPEVDEPIYPEPMVDHRTSRMRALTAYARGLGRKPPHSD